MDEDKIQAQRRQHDEDATKQRAAILGVQYLDTRPIENDLPLVSGVLEIPDMYKGHVVPLKNGGGEQAYQFGITTSTPQSLIQKMRDEYASRGELIQSPAGQRAGRPNPERSPLAHTMRH